MRLIAVGEDHRRSIGHEDAGDGGPEVRRGPRHDGDLAVEVGHGSDPDALASLVDLPSLAGGADLLAIADLGDADLPPGAALRPGVGVDGHDDDVAAVGRLGPGEGGRKIVDALDPFGDGAHGLGVLDEVDLDVR